MSWIDITQPLYNGMPVWPGDTEFQFQLEQKKSDNGVVNVGRISCSTHTGTHVDAPFHYDDEGIKMHEVDFSLYIGEAQLIHIPDRQTICAADIEREGLLNKVERLLIRTDSVKDVSQFPSMYTFLHPDVGPLLFNYGVKLIGVDVPSVDFVDSKKLEAHHALHRAGIHILENLRLGSLVSGMYELVALPLPIEGADGCPVRAILKKIT